MAFNFFRNDADSTGQQQNPDTDEGKESLDSMGSEDSMDSMDSADSDDDTGAAALLAEMLGQQEPATAKQNNTGNAQSAQAAQSAQSAQAAQANTNSNDPAAEVLQNIRTQMAEKIQGVRLPDEFDFDKLNSQDPKEQRAAYQQVQQHTIVATIEALMPVLQQAFSQVNDSLEERINNSSSQLSSVANRDRIFEQEIPAFSDPKFRPMVLHLDKQLAAQGVDDVTGRARRIRTLLHKLGVTGDAIGQDGSGNSKRRGSSGTHIGTQSGNNALDSFFPVTPTRAK